MYMKENSRPDSRSESGAKQVFAIVMCVLAMIFFHVIAAVVLRWRGPVPYMVVGLDLLCMVLIAVLVYEILPKRAVAREQQVYERLLKQGGHSVLGIIRHQEQIMSARPYETHPVVRLQVQAQGQSFELDVFIQDELLDQYRAGLPIHLLCDSDPPKECAVDRARSMLVSEPPPRERDV